MPKCFTHGTKYKEYQGLAVHILADRASHDEKAVTWAHDYIGKVLNNAMQGYKSQQNGVDIEKIILINRTRNWKYCLDCLERFNGNKALAKHILGAGDGHSPKSIAWANSFVAHKGL